jgi:putative PepSY-like beta-lactamase-inhibitor
MRRFLCVLSAVVVLAVVSFARADEGPNEIAVSKLPKKLAAILEVKYPAAELVAAFKDVDEDETFYSVTLTYNKHEYEVTISSHGEIVETTKTLAARELPEPVLKTIQDKYKNKTVKSAVEVREVGEKILRTFHVEVDSGPTGMELILDPQGKILSEESMQNVQNVAPERKK